MAGATTFLQNLILNSMFRHDPTLGISGSNASTTVIIMASNPTTAGYVKGHIVKGTTAGSFHQVTAVDTTTVTVTPAFAAAPTTGNLETFAYSPIAVYVELFTANPTDAGGGTEITGGDATRKQVTQAAASWNAPSGTPSLIDNTAAIEWTSVTWSGTVTGWGLNDTAFGATGNVLLWFDSVDKVVASTDSIRFAIGVLDITHD